MTIWQETTDIDEVCELDHPLDVLALHEKAVAVVNVGPNATMAPNTCRNSRYGNNQAIRTTPPRLARSTTGATDRG
jgi:hypothetical protein